MTNNNPKCPVCLTVQTGAHTCKRAKPLPSEPECRRLRESGNDLGSVYVPEPKCEHYSTHFKTSYRWKKDGMFAWGDVCPFCKPVEPSCEHDRPDQNAWVAIDRTYSQSFHVECPICKPVEIRKDCQEGKVYGFNPDYMKKEVEPSVEDRLRERIKELEGRLVDQAVTICEISKVFAKKIAELERKE